MRTQYRLRKVFIWATIVLLLISIAVSYLYLQYQENVIWSIVNNVMICVFTSCIIACIQSFIGYASEKHAAILSFYKEAILLEDTIINYPFMRSGFVKADEGLKDVRVITHQFMDRFKFASQCIYIGGNPDKILKAVVNLSNLYSQQIKVFREMEIALTEAIRFNDKSDEELLAEGVNILQKTQSINNRLQSLERAIEQAYNATDEQNKRTKCYKTIEAYLFSQKGEKLK